MEYSNKAQKVMFILLTVIAVFTGLSAVSATANAIYNMYSQDAWGTQWKPGGRG